MRVVVNPMRSFFKTLCDGHAILDARKRSFGKTLDGFEYHIDSSAMKYGLNRLPSELLLRIFFLIATDMRTTVVLSHVCQRFRSIINGTPAFWNRFRLSAGWKDNQILAVAERCNFRGLRADIEEKEKEEEEDSDDYYHRYRFRFDPGPTLAILSLSDHLVELSINKIQKKIFDDIRPRLQPVPIHFPKLRVLTSWGSDDITLLHPGEVSEMPSLQVLEAGFIPRLSHPGSLTKLTLDPVRRPSELLALLSSATALEELTVSTRAFWTDDEEKMVEQLNVYLPKLVDLGFKDMYSSGKCRYASIIASKIQAPSLRVLRLDSAGSELTDADIQSIISSNSFFTELHLSGIRVDLCAIPARVETLVLMDTIGMRFWCSGSVSSHRLRLVRFIGYWSAYLHADATGLRNALRDAGLHLAQIEFLECNGCKPGTYSLEDMDLAFNGSS